MSLCLVAPPPDVTTMLLLLCVVPIFTFNLRYLQNQAVSLTHTQLCCVEDTFQAGLHLHEAQRHSNS